MDYTLLHTLVWLLPAVAFTTQELVRLSVSPGIVAECGKPVTLNCDASSPGEELSIKHMEWLQNGKSVCSMDTAIPNHTHSPSDFYCEYKQGQLSLILKRVKPQEKGNYTCKLHSNQGALSKKTTVELQECCGIAEGVRTTDRLTCTFKHVYPDGDVHWFHGSHNLSDGSVEQHTSKQVEEGGWLTIRSDLERKSSHGPYNCSLMSTTSGRHIASTLVPNPKSPGRVRSQQPSHKARNGVGSLGPIWTLLCFSVLLVATLN
ncbi:hypothetical protein VZT92_002476 [Zoarces viviparus]|uniref:Ig-like domain-containing protein n=1 Tax=Zoarces viviparus TaxID=48416 RepID=A0AAW1FYU5_ZOAVI